MTWWLVALIAVLVVGGVYLVGTANRLDRLHVRTDAAWAALEAALARRAVVARAAAGVLALPRLRAVAETAESAPRVAREDAENVLTSALSDVDRSALPVELSVELDDAEHRVVIARRVYGDAVRDTLVQRRRRAVRWFKLAGMAPRPEYFEIAEPDLTREPPAA